MLVTVLYENTCSSAHYNRLGFDFKRICSINTDFYRINNLLVAANLIYILYAVYLLVCRGKYPDPGSPIDVVNLSIRVGEKTQ